VSIVDSILNIFVGNIATLPTTLPDLILYLIRIIVGIGIFLWCFGLIKEWCINIFGGRWVR